MNLVTCLPSLTLLKQKQAHRTVTSTITPHGPTTTLYFFLSFKIWAALRIVKLGLILRSSAQQTTITGQGLEHST
jgi:hypothetical protein